jgi:hypothetical protein
MTRTTIDRARGAVEISAAPRHKKISRAMRSHAPVSPGIDWIYEMLPCEIDLMSRHPAGGMAAEKAPVTKEKFREKSTCDSRDSLAGAPAPRIPQP